MSYVVKVSYMKCFEGKDENMMPRSPCMSVVNEGSEMGFIVRVSHAKGLQTELLKGLQTELLKGLQTELPQRDIVDG